MAAASCSSPAPLLSSPPGSALAGAPANGVARVELQQFAQRPRLTTVARDGDPFPALVVAVATLDEPLAAAALGTLIESRLKALDHEVELRLDGHAFHLQFRIRPDGPDVEDLLDAVREVFASPVAPSGADASAVTKRLAQLRHRRVPSPAAAAISACIGEVALDQTEAPISQIEVWRKKYLVAERTSVAVVGPAALCQQSVAALSGGGTWQHGVAATDAWPTGATIGAHLAPTRRGDTLRLALRIPSPLQAVEVAERLGHVASPLSAQLDAEAPDWQVREVTGVARVRGGCVAVTLEAEGQRRPDSLSRSASSAAHAVERAIRDELKLPHDPATASQRILGTADARQAASLAAWWALSETTDQPPGKPDVSLGIGAAGASLESVLPAFQRGLAQRPPPRATSIEQQTVVERGQGEMWVLVASQCAGTEEVAHDAGLSSLATLAVVQEQGARGAVTLEPVVTSDVVGILAHAAMLPSEDQTQLAVRVADALGHALGTTSISDDALDAARASALSRIEAFAGPTGSALEAFAESASPSHPNWLVPMSFRHTASVNRLAVEAKWRAFRRGPLRVVTIANVSAAQGEVVTQRLNRYNVSAPRKCEIEPGLAARNGRVEVSLPSYRDTHQAIVGVPVGARGDGSADFAWADVTAHLLNHNSGPLRSLRIKYPTVRFHARVIGGARKSALIVQISAESEEVSAAANAVEIVLIQLSATTPEPEALADANAQHRAAMDNAIALPNHRMLQLLSPEHYYNASAPLETSGWQDSAKRLATRARLITIIGKPG